MTISIYQIQYSDDVIGEFDPAFLKYDCRDKPEPEKREIAHMLRFYHEKLRKHSDSDYIGIVSPKFASKIGIGGEALIKWIAANPGYDVYFINPFPQLSYFHFNVWTQGEYWHPGLSSLANSLFAAAGYSTQIDSLPRNNISSLLYSNYWIGNKKFWHQFMEFVRQFYDAVDSLKADDMKRLFDIAPHYAQATYFPFVFERLFSTFIAIRSDITSLPYRYDRMQIIDKCDNMLERTIIKEWADVIDACDACMRDDLEYRQLFDSITRILKGESCEIKFNSNRRYNSLRVCIKMIKNKLLSLSKFD